MPRYDWTCTCGVSIETVRSISDRDTPPKQVCPRCGGRNFTRSGVYRTHAHVPGGLSERTPYPLCIPKAEKVFDYEQGKVTYVDKVFTSHAAQKEWMDRTDKVLFMDGEADSTFNPDSQRSTWTQGDTPPPTPHAAELAAAAHFVEQPDGHLEPE